VRACVCVPQPTYRDPLPPSLPPPPITETQGNSAKMGSMVVRGEVEGTVEFTGDNTFFGKVGRMVAAWQLHGGCMVAARGVCGLLTLSPL
jgi:hypothetical protein